MANTGDTTKRCIKSRAKSCTSCRQSKLKCDLRTKETAPCSRCTANDLVCRTDDSFKRIAARSRLKTLEVQLEQLRDSQSTAIPTYLSHAQLETLRSGSAALDRLVPGSTTSSESTVVSIREEHVQPWFLPIELQPPDHFALNGCVLTYLEVLDLFTHFEKVYLPHCRFLGDVSSLAQLETDSQFLLWTIILIALRYHDTHHHHYPNVQRAHLRLYGSLCCEAVQNILDIQGMLLFCMWPSPVFNQSRDPSFMHFGTAVSCVLAVGLDKAQDETFFGTRRYTHQFRRYPSRLLKLTWLGCFELDMQMSFWHGTMPLLAASRYANSVTALCQDPEVPRDIVNDTQIYARTTHALRLLDESSSAELVWTLLGSYKQDLANMKAASASTWTTANELTYITAMMHLAMTYFVRLAAQSESSQVHDHGPSVHAKDALLSAKDNAIGLIVTVCDMSGRLLSNSQGHQANAHPLPGSPKYVSRNMFFAATVLLRYLDSKDEFTWNAQELARDAFQKAYHFFRKLPLAYEHVRASETLEIAGRAIGSHQARLKSNVTTRMGASIRHDVNWLTGLIRGRDKDSEYSLDPTDHKDAIDAEIACPKSCPDSVHVQAGNSEFAAADGSYDLQFPFGLWDDDLYNLWLENSFYNDVSMY